MHILLQDKYNIGVLAVNIELMWLGTKWMERFAKVQLSPVYKPRHINSIFTVNTPILYIYIMYRKMIQKAKDYGSTILLNPLSMQQNTWANIIGPRWHNPLSSQSKALRWTMQAEL